MTDKKPNTEEKKLTPKQELFCSEYLANGFNGTQAAIKAGYSQASAQEIAWENLRKPVIQARIAKVFKERVEHTDLSIGWVLDNLQEVVERCLQKKPVMVWSYEDKQMVQEKDGEGNNLWEFQHIGANKALELIGKYFKMYSEGIQLPDSGIKEVKITYATPDDKPTD